jgi:hypothetical protein
MTQKWTNYRKSFFSDFVVDYGPVVDYRDLVDYTTMHGKLNTWKRRLRAFSGNTFLPIFKTNVFSEIPRYTTKMDAYQI